MRSQWAALGASAVLALALWPVSAAQAGTAPRPESEPAPVPAQLWPGGSGRWQWAPPSSWWPAAATAELNPTGMQVVARPGWAGMVADRSGALWLHGPWAVARVEPSTGSAGAWDLGDDSAFAETAALSPAIGSGVWLVSADRLRHFDGRRFVRDLPVPVEYRGGGAITDMADLGAEVWVSSAAGVARCADGVWSWVEAGQLSHVQALEVDARGSVWAAGRLSGVRSAGTVVRHDGQRWQRPAGGDPTGVVRALVADPIGGLLVRFDSRVHRLTETGWQELGDAGLFGLRDVRRAADGTIWALGGRGLLRFETGRGWRRVARAGPHPPLALALYGEEVLVADERGLRRLGDGRLRRIWTAEVPAPVASAHASRVSSSGRAAQPGTGLAVSPQRLLVHSHDEAWTSVRDYPFPFHFVNGGWQEIVIPADEWWGQPVIASDGAIWIATQRGLTRVAAERAQAIERVLTDGALYPDREGGVWVTPPSWYGWWYAQGSAAGPVDGRVLTRVRADGRRRSVPLPTEVWQLSGIFPGSRGQLWATSCTGSGSPAPCSSAPALRRWDGRWSTVAYPAAAVSGLGAAKGGFWALLWPTQGPGSSPVLARHEAGAWATYPRAGVLQDPTVTAHGSVCGGQDAGRTLVCVDAAGRITRQGLAISGALRVGADGSVWVAAQGAVARRPAPGPVPGPA